MSEKVPWSFWVVAAVAVIWNGFGAYDYVMSQTDPIAYMSGMMGMEQAQARDMMAYYEAMPTWMVAVWAIGVWSAVAATVLLVLRRRWAFHAFALSLAAILVSLVYSYLLTDGAAAMGQTGAYFSVAITVLGIFFVWYADRMTKQGVLR